MTIGKDIEGSGLNVVEVKAWNVTGGNEKNHENS
jgi:hypothetical protein